MRPLAVVTSAFAGIAAAALTACAASAQTPASHPATVTISPAPATVTTSPPPPAQGQVIGSWSGSGSEHTPAFNVPSSGDYIVKWSYYGNEDKSFGITDPTNFIIQNTGDGLGMALPNDIAAQGHGSTEVTAGDGTDSFNVQAVGHWTITVLGA